MAILNERKAQLRAKGVQLFDFEREIPLSPHLRLSLRRSRMPFQPSVNILQLRGRRSFAKLSANTSNADSPFR